MELLHLHRELRLTYAASTIIAKGSFLPMYHPVVSLLRMTSVEEGLLFRLVYFTGFLSVSEPEFGFKLRSFFEAQWIHTRGSNWSFCRGPPKSKGKGSSQKQTN